MFFSAVIKYFLIRNYFAFLYEIKIWLGANSADEIINRIYLLIIPTPKPAPMYKKAAINVGGTSFSKIFEKGVFNA